MKFGTGSCRCSKSLGPVRLAVRGTWTRWANCCSEKHYHTGGRTSLEMVLFWFFLSTAKLGVWDKLQTSDASLCWASLECMNGLPALSMYGEPRPAMDVLMCTEFSCTSGGPAWGVGQASSSQKATVTKRRDGNSCARLDASGYVYVRVWYFEAA